VRRDRQTMDYRDYLIRQHQQERMAQQFDALFTSDEDHAAAATQRIEDQAYTTPRRRLPPTTTFKSL
jgi:hypothetical protein